MRLIFYSPGHHKNTTGIELMCKSKGVDLEFTKDSNRLMRGDYDIAVINSNFISPDSLPSHVNLIYGPQHFVFPVAPFLGDLREDLSGRCVYNCLSPWNQIVYREFGSMIMQTVCFPFAVDVDRFCPSGKDKTLDCIVYVKHREPGFVNRNLDIIRQKGLSYRVFSYGSYSEDDYINTLQIAKFMITIDAHESQGFALEEAMSCGVPLLVLDATSMFDEYNGSRPVYWHLQGQKNLLSTSVSYWSDKCGIKIMNPDDLPCAIDRMMAEYTSFSPREFILETVSPRVCMERILNYFYSK